jgi:hypothetical protein
MVVAKQRNHQRKSKRCSVKTFTLSVAVYNKTDHAIGGAIFHALSMIARLWIAGMGC